MVTPVTLQHMKASDRATLQWFMIVLMILAVGCCPIRKSNRRCNISNDTLISSVNTVTTYRDTVITMMLKGDTLSRISEILRDSVNLYKSEISELESPLARSIAWVTGGKLNHALLQKDTLLEQKIENGIKTTTTTSAEKKVINHTRIINEPTKWQWFQIYFGRVALCAFLVAFVIRLKSGKGQYGLGGNG